MLNADHSRKIQLIAQRVSSRALTQSQVAKATGVDQSQVSRILAGRSRRASKNVLKLCEYAESLASPDPEAGSLQEQAAAIVSELFRAQPTENAALVSLLASLHRWRSSWDGSK